MLWIQIGLFVLTLIYVLGAVAMIVSFLAIMSAFERPGPLDFVKLVLVSMAWPLWVGYGVLAWLLESVGKWLKRDNPNNWLCAVVVLFFWQPNCGPCTQVKPAVDAAIREGTDVRAVNTASERPDLVRDLIITSTPSFVAIDERTGRVLRRVDGRTLTKEQIKQMGKP